MGLTPEQLGTGFVGLIIILGALGQYIRSLKATRPADPVLAGIGVELGNREQTERMIAVHLRIAVALEALADKEREELTEMHKSLLARLDSQERANNMRRTSDR